MEVIRCERKDLSRLNLRISALLDTSALVFTQISFRFALAGGIEALESENRRLRADLEDKEREFSRQNDQMRQLLIERDGQSTK